MTTPENELDVLGFGNLDNNGEGVMPPPIPPTLAEMIHTQEEIADYTVSGQALSSEIKDTSQTIKTVAQKIE